METHPDLDLLIRRAKAGDREAFDVLAGHYGSRLESRISRRLGGYLRHKIDVDDVTQETFLKAFQSIDSFQNRGGDSFLNWLSGISDNLLLYWAREFQRIDLMPLLRDARSGETSPSQKMRRQERFERLQEVLGRLAEDQREVILLARVEGLPTKDIAKRLGRSPDAVRQLLWRSLQKMRMCLEDTESLNLPNRSLLNETRRERRDENDPE